MTTSDKLQTEEIMKLVAFACEPWKIVYNKSREVYSFEAAVFFYVGHVYKVGK